jgi:hypothetical protein
MKLFKKDDQEVSEDKLLEKKVDEMMSVESDQPKNVEETDQLDKGGRFGELTDQLEELDVDDDVPAVKTIKLDSSPESDFEEKPQKELNQTIVNKDNLDDQGINMAVDDIVTQESDQILEDSPKSEIQQPEKPKKTKFKKLLKSKIFYLILLILLGIFSVPYTRYKILGYVITKNVSLSITDSITKDQVSNVSVFVNGRKYSTSSAGTVSFNLGVGPHQIQVSKAYYKSYEDKLFVGFFSNTKQNIKLLPTGRQLTIKLLNIITNQPISGGSISYQGVFSKSNLLGVANLVIPDKENTDNIIVNARGYNQTNLAVKTDNKNLNETLNLVPSGTIYYLKQINGIMDVVGSNLDGSNPKIILNGTGNENVGNSFLYPSPDWKNLVLITNRSGSNQSIYTVNPSNSQIKEIDSSTGNINPIGWYNDQFIYQNEGSYNTEFNPGNNQIKSYNEESNQLNVVDQSQVQGSQPSFVYQDFSTPKIIGNQLLYISQWYQSSSYIGAIPSNTLKIASLDNYSIKNILSKSQTSGNILQIIQPYPNSAYIETYNSLNNSASIYQYSNGSLSLDNAPNAFNNFQNLINQTTTLNPSGTKTAWSVLQNGSPVVFVGNQNGTNQTEINNLKGYSFVAWYNDQYMLVSKNNKLYVNSITGNANKPVLVGSFLSLN